MVNDPDYPLPEWASALANGEYVLGAQLPTRDGRRIGNAHIIATVVKDMSLIGLSTTEQVHTVLTDAGSEARLTVGELGEMFWPPVFVSDVGEVIERFARPPEPQ